MGQRSWSYDGDVPHPSWNDSYASGGPLPWDTGTPDPLLIEMIEYAYLTVTYAGHRRADSQSISFVG